MKADNIKSGLKILEVGVDVGTASDAGGGVGGVGDGVGVVGGDARGGDDRGEQLPTVPEGFLVVGRRGVVRRSVVVIQVGGGGVVVRMLSFRVGKGDGSAGGADRAGAARGATRRAVGMTTWAVAIPVRKLAVLVAVIVSAAARAGQEGMALQEEQWWVGPVRSVVSG